MKTEQTNQQENPVEPYQAPAIEVIDIELQQNFFGSLDQDITGEGA